MLFSLLFLLLVFHVESLYHSWSLLATIELDAAETSSTYGESESMVGGRGFQTMITGTSSTVKESALYVHTSDDGRDLFGTTTWSQQQVLTPEPLLPASAGFGKVVVSFNQTVIVSAPYSTEKNTPELGTVFIYNGTRRHWTQLQQLIPPDYGDPHAYAHFGISMSFRGNRLLVGAPGAGFELGYAYVYDRPHEGGLFTLSDTLKPSLFESYTMTHLSSLVVGGSSVVITRVAGSMFAETISMYDQYATFSAKHPYPPAIETIGLGNRNIDPDYNRTGSVYMFQFAGKWSQQQQLFADDFEHLRYWEKLDNYAYGVKFFPNDLGLTSDTLAVGIKRLDQPEYAQQSVQLYSPFDQLGLGYSKWSVQQKLILDCCSESTLHNENDGMAVYDISKTLVSGAKLHIGDDLESLFVTMLSPTNHSEFVFQPDGYSATGYKTWSLQQILQTNIPYQPNVSLGEERYRSPSQFGGTLFMASNNNTIELQSKYHNGSCLLLWLSDHFGDGWDSLVLTVRAPDTTNDSFSPKCNQVDPFYIRYCPYKPTDEGVYIIKPYAAQKARLFWEISWKVQVESTGVTYMGDADTKMMFNFNSTTLDFSFVQSLNPKVFTQSYANTTDVVPCFRCAAITTASWAQLQNTADMSFWPFVAYGAPYFISDIRGRLLFFSGRVCDGIMRYECYQTLPSGQYLMRQGGGLFGKILDFPREGASWEGCGTNGTWRDQLIFEIVNQTCSVLQVFHYNSTCSIPDPAPNGIQDSAFGSTLFPTATTSSNTVASTSRRRLEAMADGFSNGAIDTVGRYIDAIEEVPAYMERPEDAFMF